MRTSSLPSVSIITHTLTSIRHVSSSLTEIGRNRLRWRFSTRTAQILRLAFSTTTWASEGALHVGCSPGRGPPIAHASAVLLGAGGLHLGEGISLKKKLMEAASTAPTLLSHSYSGPNTYTGQKQAFNQTRIARLMKPPAAKRCRYLQTDDFYFEAAASCRRL